MIQNFDPSQIIDHDIPFPEIPVKPPTNREKVEMTIKAMKEGDSFECNGDCRSKAMEMQKCLGVQLIAQKTTDGLYRIWLLKRVDRPKKKLGRPKKIVTQAEPK